MLLYHATSEPCAESIAREGFRLDVPRRNDPGDLGHGVYLTGFEARARSWDHVVLTVALDDAARLLVFSSSGRAYDWMAETVTALGHVSTCATAAGREARGAAARALADHVRSTGFDGVAVYEGSILHEVVVFDPTLLRVLAE